MILALCLLPFLGGFAILRSSEEKAGKISVIVTGLLFVIIGFILFFTKEGLEILLWPGLELSWQIDQLGKGFSFLVLPLWFLATIYARGYMEGQKARSFFFFYLITLGTVLGLALAGNLLTYYLFYELLTLTTYPLVIQTGTREARQAGKTYLIFSFAGAGFVLAGLFLLYGLTGSVAFVPGGFIGQDLIATHPFWAKTALFFLVAGFGVKGALIPIHFWLPGAMVAPTPVSALLHAVAVVKAGIFGLLRVSLYIFGPAALASIGIGGIKAWAALTILLGSMIALQQDKLKKRLAYSTIGQLSYIFLGVLLLNPAGLQAGLFHFLAHALLKITLFFCAGIITHETGCTKVSELDGIGLRLPRTMVAFALASIGLVGIPFTLGFISKWYFLSADPAWSWVFILSAFLNALYLFPVVTRAFFREGKFAPPLQWEASPAMLLPTLFLAGGALLLGIFFRLPLEFINTIQLTINN